MTVAAAVQSAVTSKASAIEGMPADASALTRDVATYISEEASAEIPFGVMVCRGSTDEDNGALLLNTSAAAMEQLLAGVVMWTDVYAKPSELGDTGLKPGVTLNVLQRGRIWVRPEDAVDPGDAVRVRCVVAGSEVKGAFRSAADSTDCVDISSFARWRSSAGAGELAILEIDMTNAKLADAD